MFKNTAPKKAVCNVCREEGFDNFKEMKNMIFELEILLDNRDLTNLKDKVETFEFYLRHEFLEHLNPQSKTKSHNTIYAFYSEKQILSKCEGTGFENDFDFLGLVMDCSKCNLGFEIFHEFENLCNELEEEKKSKMIKRLGIRKENLDYYIGHEIRYHVQNKYYEESLEKLKANETIVLIDYKMKFQMTNHFETKSEFFGKRGVSILGVMFIFLSERKEMKSFYYDLVTDESIKQDWWMSASALEVGIKEFSRNYPNISKIKFFSDCGGHFLTTPFLFSLPNICKPLEVSSYTFFEAGEGKSAIDHHFAWLTNTWKSFLANENKNLNSIDELIEASNLVKNTRMILYQLNQGLKKTYMVLRQLSSKISHLEYTYENGKWKEILAFEQSKIGTGILINQEVIKSCWKDKPVETTGATLNQNLEIEEEFQDSPLSLVEEMMDLTEEAQSRESELVLTSNSNKSSNMKEIVPYIKVEQCPHCLNYILPSKNLEQHILECERRMKKLERMRTSSLEKIEQFTNISFKKGHIPKDLEMKVEPKDYPIVSGYARKRKRTLVGLNKEQKNFLIKVFEQGEDGGKKSTSSIALKYMREKMIVDERVKDNQIRNFFKTLKSKKKKQTFETLQKVERNKQLSTKKAKKKPKKPKKVKEKKKEKRKIRKKKKRKRKREKNLLY